MPFHQWYFVTSSSGEHWKVCKHTVFFTHFAFYFKDSVFIPASIILRVTKYLISEGPLIVIISSRLSVWLDCRTQSSHARLPTHITHCLPPGSFVSVHKRLVVWWCIIYYSANILILMRSLLSSSLLLFHLVLICFNNTTMYSDFKNRHKACF